jgi:hypothetical protein
MAGKGNLATLRRWQPGNTAPRRSKAVDKALRYARNMTLEAIEYCGRVMRDESEATRLRLKAAEIILLHGMPKGEAALRAFNEGDLTSITIHIADHRATPVSASEPVSDTEGPVITIDAPPAGSGDD